MSNYATTSLELGAVKRQFHYRPQTSDEAIFKQVFIDQQYNPQRLRRAPELVAFLERRRATGRRPLVIDAGANIGASALYFAYNLPDALIVAIEPDPDNFKLLSKNVEGLNVEPMQAALSSSAGGRARLVDPGLGHWAYRTQPLAGEGGTGDSIRAALRGRSCNASRSSTATSSIRAKISIRSRTISTRLWRPAANAPTTQFRTG
jgi:FkbM family methyltransferase